MISVISETAKPITIPPEYVQYADKHSIFELMQVWIKNIIIPRHYYERWLLKDPKIQ